MVISIVYTVYTYEYKGWIFEYSDYTGCWPLRKDMEPRKRAGARFYAMIGEFLEESAREQYRIGGGCIRV
jgi:hypothetical protein